MMPPLAQGDGDKASRQQTLRNRVNQRNFRNRRLQYIGELEARVAKCRDNQVQATKEVQAAARAVAVENTLLRDFLKTTLHRTDHDIDVLLVHLHDKDRSIQCEHRENLGHSRGLSRLTILESMDNNENMTDDQSRRINHGPPHPGSSSSTALRTRHPELLDPAGEMSDATMQQERLNDLNEAPVSTLTATTTSQPEDTEQYAPGSIPMPLDSQSSFEKPRDCITCKDAVDILAVLRQQHADELFEELGCVSAASCYVKNTEMMQMMSQEY